MKNRVSFVKMVLATLCVVQALLSAGAESDAFRSARKRMVTEQLAGPGRDVRNARVLSVMGKVPRHEFVPERMRAFAYEDQPLPIGHDQTISQPYIVAFMTEKLEPKPSDRVLEIGTGSGYQAAVLAELVPQVYTIEIVAPLADQAARTLAELGFANVTVRVGDGYLGWPEAGPFDAILVTAATDHGATGGRSAMRQQEAVEQKVVGDDQNEHSHDALVHSHDHYHVAHHHVSGTRNEFEHRAQYHVHEHNHAPLTHAHRGRSEDEERDEDPAHGSRRRHFPATFACLAVSMSMYFQKLFCTGGRR